jgi:bifunctional DNA-binding transcriptional regulator/antitoxin component of YhaV-PrlF toxin-antitoxin module
MEAPAAAPSVAAPAEEADSITIPKSVLGERNCKPGERLEMTVTDVDPETGDVEARLANYASKSEGGDDDMAGYAMETPDES